MERHKPTKNAPSTIKVPLQRLSKSGRTVFAYMRRSTTKKEQASSLPQQEEGIEIIARELQIELEGINAFTESRSGYENRKRPEWNKMLEEIDELAEPCTILCRDTSRLSRNPTDNLAIANRMFGDNKHKKVIEAIYYLGTGMKVEKWDDKTNKKVIVDTLHQNYTDSMENKEKCIGGVLLKLDAGEFPYHPPHGLKRVNHLGEPRRTRSEPTVLMQDDKMPFVRHAFEMKANGRSAKEICKYLKHYGNINLSTKNIIETLIGNTVYRGEYREKTTGKLFDKIKFWEGKHPIDPELWEKANAKVGKRGHGFGEGQKEHIAPGLIKHESGKDLYIYKAKGIYNAYQTEIKGENGKRKSIGIMESKLVREFLNEVVPKIQFLWYKQYLLMDIRGMIKSGEYALLHSIENKSIAHIKKHYENFEKELLKLNTFNELIKGGFANDKQIYDFFHTKERTDTEKEKELREARKSDLESMENMVKLGLIKKGTRIIGVEEAILLEEDYKNLIRKESIISINEEIKRSPKLSNIQSENEAREKQKKELELKKKELENKKLVIEDDAWDRGFDMEFVKRKKGQIDEEIQGIEAQIEILSESNNIEEYLDRLPQILLNLHELSSKVQSEADYEGMRDDIRQLMELVLHELTLTNKKELRIKLLEGLDNLETEKMGNGRTCSKGYIYISIYHKMRKRQYGNRWMTQFVPLCREEVKRLKENKKMHQVGIIGNSIQVYNNNIENNPVNINSIHGITL